MTILTLGETHRLGQADEPDHATVPATDMTTDTLMATLREQLADMRRDRDHWRGVAAAITRQIAEATTRQIIDQRERRPWWRRQRRWQS
jgi:hypothetical protein